MSRMQRPEVYDRHASKRTREQTEESDERQQQMRAAALKLAGVIEGDDPGRAENAAAIVRSRLIRKHGR